MKFFLSIDSKKSVGSWQLAVGKISVKELPTARCSLFTCRKFVETESLVRQLADIPVCRQAGFQLTVVTNELAIAMF